MRRNEVRILCLFVMKRKKPAACATGSQKRYEKETFFLFLSALLAYEVGATEDGEDSDARAEGGVSVAGATMNTRKSGETTVTVAVFEVGVFLLRGVAALEEATAISEGGHAQSEDDRECQC
jgi:hypothetical protein